VLAFFAVQGASFVQSPPVASVAKGEFAAEPGVRLQADQVPPVSWVEMIAPVLLVPMALAVLCYLLVRRTV